MSQSEQYNSYEGNFPISSFFSLQYTKVFLLTQLFFEPVERKFVTLKFKLARQFQTISCSSYVQYNRKATSNNPLMDYTVTSGLTALKYLFWCITCPLVHFFSPSCRGTPPVSGHLPLVPWVSAYGRFDCI